MVHACIPATQKAEIGRNAVKANLGKKLARHHHNKQTGVVACTCHPSYMGGEGRLWFEIGQKKIESLSKNNNNNN
jgi:hypothetical protein